MKTRLEEVMWVLKGIDLQIHKLIFNEQDEDYNGFALEDLIQKKVKYEIEKYKLSH